MLCFLLFVVAAYAHGNADPLATCDGRSPSEDLIYHSSFGNVDYDESKLNLTAPILGITRAAVMACAKDWVSRAIPYCQCNGPEECCGHCPYCGSTRCDCSGYVSHCWGLSQGYTTRTLGEVSTRITKDELKEGDIMLYAADHVIIFGGWTSTQKTHYHAYQEPGCHTTGPHHAFESVTVYPNSWNPSDFLPYRFNHIQD